MNFSIIIVSWNVREFLRKCLLSIYRETKNSSFEVLLIDNASADGSGEMAQALNLPHFTFIQNDKNRGFAAAVNQGLRQAKGEYLLLLNPDTEFKDGTLDKLAIFLKENPRYGVVGCQILNPDGTIQPSVRMFPDLFSQSLISLKLHHLIPAAKFLGKYFSKDFDYRRTQEVDQVMGAFFCIKRAVVEQIGLFDENFYLWFEEVDFCKRAKKAGWPIVYTSVAQTIHYGAQSFQQLLPLSKQWKFNRSMLYYFKKHHSFFVYLFLLLIQPLSLFLAFLVQIFKKK